MFTDSDSFLGDAPETTGSMASVAFDCRLKDVWSM
jgi:hypothetical protein